MTKPPTIRVTPTAESVRELWNDVNYCRLTGYPLSNDRMELVEAHLDLLARLLEPEADPATIVTTDR